MITRSPSGEVTIRQPGRCLQIAVYLAITCVLWVPGLIGIGVLIWLYRPAGLACLTAAVLSVAWGVIRVSRMHVRFDDGGVTVRNFWRTRLLSWDEVSHFTDGGKDWWALKVVRRSGRAIEATGTTSGAKSIVTTGVLVAIGEIAERYHVCADISGLTLVARTATAVAGGGADSARIAAYDADLCEPADLKDSLAGPRQGAEREPDGHGNRSDARPPSRAIYSLSVAGLACAVGAVGLGTTDLIAQGTLPGYLVGVGMASGVIAATLASITWFGMAAPKSQAGTRTEAVRRLCRAAQRLGILGLILLAIGSGNGGAL